MIGGDTCSSPAKFFISVTLIAVNNAKHIKKRNGARAGDYLCVVGNLGWAHLGLVALEKNLMTNTKFNKAFLKPTAKVNEGMWLGRQKCITSIMDISDGLHLDLKRLCNASSCGAQIHLKYLPQNNSFNRACKSLSLDPLEVVLTGGEDYSLLFTVKKSHFMQNAQQFQAIFGYAYQVLGEIVKAPGITFVKDDKFITDFELKLNPFTHFGEAI